MGPAGRAAAAGVAMPPLTKSCPPAHRVRARARRLSARFPGVSPIALGTGCPYMTVAFARQLALALPTCLTAGCGQPLPAAMRTG